MLRQRFGMPHYRGHAPLVEGWAAEGGEAMVRWHWTDMSLEQYRRTVLSSSLNWFGRELKVAGTA